MPHLTILTTDVMGSFEFREAFNRYLARVGPDAPVKNLAEFLADGRFHPSIKPPGAVCGHGRRHPSVEYKSRWWKREALRQAVMTVIAHNDLDALLYPHQKRLVAGIGEEARAQWGIIQWDGVSCHHLPWRLFPANTQRPTRRPNRDRIVGPGVE